MNSLLSARLYLTGSFTGNALTLAQKWTGCFAKRARMPMPIKTQPQAAHIRKPMVRSSIRSSPEYAQDHNSHIEQHGAVAGQGPVVLAADALRRVGGGPQGLHGGQHLVVVGLGLFQRVGHGLG